MENFVLKAKSAIKRLAAVSTGAVMLGATMFGAVAAADLSMYPSPYVKDGKWVGLIVVGADAAPADVIGATDIAATLAQQAATTAAGTGTTTTVGGKTVSATLGRFVGDSSRNSFDVELQDDDIKGLQDTTITFQGSSYDVEDEIVFRNATGPSRVPAVGGPQVMTSVSSADDDYKDGVFLETDKKGIAYYYVFDTSINVSKASTTDPLAIKFLGKNMKVTSVALGSDTNAAQKLTARVGEEVFLNVGDTVTIEGKKLTWKNVGSATTNTPVIVDIDGVVETVTGTETVNGLEVSIADSFYSDNLNERAATLILGKDAVETYTTGDKFIVPCAAAWHRSNCDKNTPDWKWEFVNLTADAATALSAGTGPIIGITSDYIVNDNSDNPITVGGMYDFPAGGFSLKFNKLTVPDDKYQTITIKFDASNDFSQVTGFDTQTSEPGFIIESDVSEGLYVTAGGTNKRVSTVYLSINNSVASASIDGNLTDIFYKDPTDNKIKLAATVDTPANAVGANLNSADAAAATTLGAKILEINYEDTKSTNAMMSLVGNASTTPPGTQYQNLTFEFNDDNGYLPVDIDTWSIALGTDSGPEYNTLGSTANTEEAKEVTWNLLDVQAGAGNTLTAMNKTYMGTKDENHRGLYGEILVDPKSNGASNRVKFKIPRDVVRAELSVVGPDTTVSTTGGAVTISPVSGVPVAQLDTEVTDKTARDMILVGGPAVNRLAAEALGLKYPTSGAASTVPENAAMLKLVENAFGGTRVALVVAGWEASNTRDAATVLKDFKSYSDKLTGKSVTVSSSAGKLVVSAPSV
jgi:hypothetical protein